MILVDEGKVNSDDPVAKYLPEFKDQWVQVESTEQRRVLARPSRPIQVRDLLTHTTGLPAKSAMEEPTNDVRPLAARVRSYTMLTLGTEPGAKYLYSNAGINTVGRIVEGVSGMPFERFIDERILRPLRMFDPTFCRTPRSSRASPKPTSLPPAPSANARSTSSITHSTVASGRLFPPAACSRPRPICSTSTGCSWPRACLQAAVSSPPTR